MIVLSQKGMFWHTADGVEIKIQSSNDITISPIREFGFIGKPTGRYGIFLKGDAPLGEYNSEQKAYFVKKEISDAFERGDAKYILPEEG